MADQKLAKTVNDELQRYRVQLDRALPPGMSSDRFARMALTAWNINPDLQKCSMRSLFGALVECAQMGLTPTRQGGEAYLVPFKTKAGGYECTLIPGYRGMIKLAYQSDQVAMLKAEVVRVCDQFSYALGSESYIKHVRGDWGGDETNRVVTHAYAVAVVLTGDHKETVSEVLDAYDIDRIKGRSKASQRGPWVSDFEAMAKKSAIRQLMRWLPKSDNASKAEMLAQTEESGHSQRLDQTIQVDLTPEPVKPGPAVESADDQLDALAKAGESRGEKSE